LRRRIGWLGGDTSQCARVDLRRNVNKENVLTTGRCVCGGIIADADPDPAVADCWGLLGG
jgi:hypothetical protein